MSTKDNLLSIGEISALTGASVQALRYYERKSILHPAFIDPDTGYRYYSLDQIYNVGVINNCVQFDIPLKKLVNVLNEDGMPQMKDFLEECIKNAERKIQILKCGVDGLNKALQKMELRNQHNPGQIYSRELPEKYYHVKPSNQPLKGADLLKTLTKALCEVYGEDNISRITDEDNLDELLPLPDVGCLCQHSPDGINYYGFSEIPAAYANKNTISIPAGTYYFRQDEISKIDIAPEIFKEQLAGRDTFMIIETQESFLSKTKLNQPMYELRLIAI